MRIPQLALVLLAACLAACETAYKDGVPNERSPWFVVPVASKLVLHRSIEVAPGQGAAYLQNGRLLPWYDVDQHGSYCALSVPARWDVAQLVSPGEFVVRRVSQRPMFTLAAGHGGGLRRVATRDRDGDGMTYEVLATVMDIHSQQQPEVRALTCASWCLPQGRMCNTVADIRRALGSYFTVELAPAWRP